MKNLELIDKYFNNSLNTKEQLLFNELIQNDEGFKAEFLFQLDLKKAIAKNKQDHLKKTLSGFESKIDSRMSFFNIPIKWMVAASLILIVGLGSFIIKNSFFPSTEKLFVENYSPYRNIIRPIVRGEESNSIEYSAFLAYENGDFHKAINLFNSLDNQNTSFIPFYKAMCYLSLDKMNEAIHLLEPLSTDPLTYSENPDEKLNFKSEWYLGLAYLKNGENDKAISKFLIVIDQPCDDCIKKRKAENILSYIN